VLSGARPIGTEVCERVHRAIEQLDYQPSYAAGALAGGRSKAIALVVPDGDFALTATYGEFINGTAMGAQEAGYHLLLHTAADSAVEEMRQLHGSGVIAGVVLMEIRLRDSRVKTLREAGVPLVLIGRTANPVDLDFVDRDFVHDSRLAVDHLHALGHRRIALVNEQRPRGHAKLGVDERFSQGIHERSAELGMTVQEVFFPNRPEAGQDALAAVLALRPRVTAVLTLGDLLSLGFISATHQRGIDVPHDLSVIALAGVGPNVGLTSPPLTTVSIPDRLLGEAAAQALIRRLSDPDAELTQSLWTGTLTVRGTTARRK